MNPKIGIIEHRARLTQLVIAQLIIESAPKNGLEIFFPKKTTNKKALNIEVRKGKRLVAVDVKRCTDPNMNTFSNETEKIFVPPYYNEGYDVSQCNDYLQTFAKNREPQPADVASMVRESSENLQQLKYKIERAIELQRSQVLQTGIVKLINGSSIDYGREAQSISVASKKWNTADADILKDLEAGGNFIRTKGLSSGNVIDVILGSNAISDLLSNEKLMNSNDFRRVNKMDINMPRFDNATGFTFYGQVAGVDFIFNLFGYSDGYETRTESFVPYIDKDNVIMIAQDFHAITGFASVPGIFDEDSNGGGKFVAPVETDFYVRDYVDEKIKSWIMEISSAPLVVPIDIDKLYTLKVR